MVLRFKNFVVYWRKNITEAKEWHEFVILVIFVLWQVGYILSKWLHFGFIESVAHSEILDKIEMMLIAAFSIWCFLWLPFDRYEKQQKKHDEEMSVQQKDSDSRIRSLTEQLNSKTSDILNSLEKKLILQGLVHLRVSLVKRRSAICTQQPRNYIEQKVDGVDKETEALLKSIVDFFLQYPSQLGGVAIMELQSGDTMEGRGDLPGASASYIEWNAMQEMLGLYDRNIGRIIDKLKPYGSD